MSATAVLAMGGLNSALAGTATLIATAFTLSTADRWIKRRQPHELAWTIAMALFAMGSACLWWAESTGWNLFVFRMFFLAGAVLNVSWLALGTVCTCLVDNNLEIVFDKFSSGYLALQPALFSLRNPRPK
jgi:hypothetical protein